MKHEIYQNNLKAYIDNELDAIMKLRLDSHLRNCESCKIELDEIKSLSEKLKKIIEPTPSLILRESILDRVKQEKLQAEIRDVYSNKHSAQKSFQPLHLLTALGCIMIAAWLGGGYLKKVSDKKQTASGLRNSNKTLLSQNNVPDNFLKPQTDSESKVSPSKPVVKKYVKNAPIKTLKTIFPEVEAMNSPYLKDKKGKPVNNYPKDNNVSKDPFSHLKPNVERIKRERIAVIPPLTVKNPAPKTGNAEELLISKPQKNTELYYAQMIVDNIDTTTERLTELAEVNNWSINKISDKDNKDKNIVMIFNVPSNKVESTINQIKKINETETRKVADDKTSAYNTESFRGGFGAPAPSAAKPASKASNTPGAPAPVEELSSINKKSMSRIKVTILKKKTPNAANSRAKTNKAKP